jgi:hypothetical protein
MLKIQFDRKIRTRLPSDKLWNHLMGAFEDTQSSALWPKELEEFEPAQLEEGKKIQATYKLGKLPFNAHYRIKDFKKGKSFRYLAEPEHALKGGAKVEIRPLKDGSELRWKGEYRPRLRPQGLVSLLFVRLYFLRVFFVRLEQQLRMIEKKES